MTTSLRRDEPQDPTLTHLFDLAYDRFKLYKEGKLDVHEKFLEEIKGNGNGVSCIKQYEEFKRQLIKDMETLTVKVSEVDLFSRNESYKEMNPFHLKFLLLPYMLGTIWQVRTDENRKDVCEVSKIYFKDFLKRCVDIELIETPDCLIQKEEEEEKEEEKEEDKKEIDLAKFSKATNEARRLKVLKWHENQELDEKIKALIEFANQYGEDVDFGCTRDLYEAILRRAVSDAEENLDYVLREESLIRWNEERQAAEIERNGGVAPVRTTVNPQPPRKTLKPFIITKDSAQKAVYGLGYPSLPVMTVEELYQQRRETGQWGPPPQAGASHSQNPVDEDETEAIMREELQERDDDAELARQRGYDEYKDDHRRGWGNRFNRS